MRSVAYFARVPYVIYRVRARVARGMVVMTRVAGSEEGIGKCS